MATALVTEPTGHAKFAATKRFGALDGLRAVSVVAVIWQHTAGFNQTDGILSRGYLGVDCFFVISGFLITTLLLREHVSTGRVSLKRFYLRRSLRIFPIYFTVLAAYIVLMFTQRHTAEGREFFHNLPFFATYTSNWFSTGGDHATFYFAWSLATEEQFYLFWPPLLVAVLYAARSMRPAKLAFALGALVVVDQVATQVGGSIPWRMAASLATPILLGALAAVALSQPPGYAAAARFTGARWTAPIVGVVTLVALQVGVPDVAAQALLAVLVLSLVVREDTPLHPALTWRPIAWVGGISYGIYLMQMLAANLVRPVIGHQRGIAVFAATIPVVLVAAYVSSRWFETPIRALAHRETNG